ncbi:MAG: alpha-amylase family glycosyl hydrolase [Gammaproteobacteria bacterium]|nr:alpha-amylase family glycosyl hydrolase [Gammaproteobacteria bacterium]
MLSQTTIQAINELLAVHEEGGYTRGLFTAEQLEEIDQALEQLATWLSEHKPQRIREAEKGFSPQRRFSHKDALCIAYVDHVRDGKVPAAVRLQRFFNSHLAGLYSHLHILPHFPCPLIHPSLEGPASRADGGFEPMSYRMDPSYGAPLDLQAINADLMFDFVLNHLSAKGEWFQRFLEDDPEYEDFFLTISGELLETLDISQVFRPRQHHPVFEFANSKGESKHVWCTFSATQADINIKNPKVFIKVMEALVKDFVGQGATWIRLDAVGYLVKMLGLTPGEPKTNSFGEPETHNVLKAMNRYIAEIAPSVTLVAEVNATKDVIATYYGDKGDEAHMVYEFPMAPLSLFAIYTGNAAPVLAWAKERLEHPDRIGLAFTNSHDGIGVLPMRDVPPLPGGTPALDYLIDEVQKRGAGINYKSQVVEGKQVEVPYEACITWAQAILSPQELELLKQDRLEDPAIALVADRFLASQSFAYAAPHCVPADYLGAVAVLLNDEQTFERTEHNRNKNRGLVDEAAFEKAVQSPQTSYEKLVAAIVERKRALLEARQGAPAFSPYAECRVGVMRGGETKDGVKPVFSVLRRSPDGADIVLALTNSADAPQQVSLNAEELEPAAPALLEDLLSGEQYELAGSEVALSLRPYQVAWLRVRPS